MAKSCFLIVLISMSIMWLSECGYLTPEHVEEHIKRLISQKYQLYVINLGQTVNNNSLKAYVITGIKKQQSSIGQLLHYPATLITSYMHPREPYSIKLMQTVLDDVLNNYQSDYFFRYMLDNTLLILFPFVNIDGYYLYQKLIESNANKQLRQSYRKNMNKYGKCAHEWEYGVDINRNFGSAWGSLHTSDLQCGEEYRGPNAFSQKQSRAIRTLFSKFKITLAIDIHSYGNQWIYPYASQSTNNKFEENQLFPLYSDLIEEFKKLKRPMKGCFESLGYTADGVYIDWALDQGALSFAVQIGKAFGDDVEIDSEILFQAQQLFHTVLKKNSISYKKYHAIKENNLVIKSTSLLNFDIQVLSSDSMSLGVKRLKSKESVVYKLNGNQEQVTLKVIDTKIEQQLTIKELEEIQLTYELLESKNKNINKKYPQFFKFDEQTIVLIVISLSLLIIAVIAYCIGKHRYDSLALTSPNIKLKSPTILQQTINDNLQQEEEQNDKEKQIQKKEGQMEMPSVQIDNGDSPISTTDRIFLG